MTNPQNPYESYLVSASAGCGKTYQLSQRFLYLVAAGAPPSSILTVTFTKKAANEMRARIIEDATRLWSRPDAQESFDQAAAEFCANARGAFPKPRSAQETAEAILASTQQLKVSTIDALFLEWVKRFTSEAFLGDAPLKQVELIPDYDQHQLYQRAWDTLVHSLNERLDLLTDDQRSFLGMHGFMALRGRLQQLLNHETLIWLLESSGQASAFNPIPPPDTEASSDFGDLKERLRALAGNFSPAFQNLVDDSLNQATSIVGIAASRVFTQKTLRLSGSYIKGKNKELHSSAITAIESIVLNHTNAERIDRLNAMGGFLMRLSGAFCEIREGLKREAGYVEFSDLAKACFRLFTQENVAGARFLLERPYQHVMLDEFQDTSRLQWGIFRELCKDLLSKNHGLANQAPYTVFIVGDVKQSIYGFREADPRLMDEVLYDLDGYGIKKVPLNESFRSSNELMQFTNAVFDGSRFLLDFPTHSGAKTPAGTFVNPNVGFIKIFPECEDVADEDQSPIESEAKLVAQELQNILTNAALTPVYDKNLKAMRPIEPRDCAILFRKSTHAALYELHLRKLNLPTARAKNDGFFARQEVQDAVALIRYLAHTDDLLSLCTVLKSSFGQVSDHDVIAALAASADAKEQRVTSFWQALTRLNPSALALQEDLLAFSAKRPHEALIHLAEERAYPFLRALYANHEASQALANLAQFIELCNNLERDGYNTFASLAQRLVDFHESDLLGNAATTPNAVSLLTIHKAKGLEYPLVVLVDCSSEWETVDRYWVKVQDGGLSYIGTSDQHPIEDANFAALLDANKFDLQKESMRLLYVAVTRARQYFIATAHKPYRAKDSSLGELTYLQLMHQACQSIGGKPNDQGVLSFYFQDAQSIPPAKNATEAADALRISDWALTRTPGATSAIAEQILSIRPSDAGKDSTSHFRESASDHVAETEDASSAAYGSLIHAWLEAVIKKQRLNKNASCQKLLMNNPAWTQADADDAWEKARQEVEALINSSTWIDLTQNALALRAEVPLVRLHNGVLIRGKIDLIVEKTDATWVIDFKTAGDARHESDYARQLSSYARSVKDWYPSKPVKTAVYYTRHNRLSEIKMAADKRSHSLPSLASPNP